MSFFRRSAKESPPDDESVPPPTDDESEAAPPDSDEDDDPPDDESQGPPESVPPDSDEDDLPDDASEGPPESLPPDSDDDEALPSDSDDDIEERKRPSRRISRHEKSDSFDLAADDIGMDSPTTKQNKLTPPLPNVAPGAPRLSERLSRLSKRASDFDAPKPSPSFVADTLKDQTSEVLGIEEDLASLSYGLDVKDPVKLDHSKNKSDSRLSTLSLQTANRSASQSAHRASLLAAFNDLEAVDPIPEVIEPPLKDLSKSQSIVAAASSAASPKNASPRKQEQKKRTVITAEDLADFIMLNGCYEGDAYETLGVKIVDYGLQVYIKGADEIVEMSLQDTQVEGYHNDELSFTLIQNGNIKIFFKCHKKDDRKTFFESLPEGLISFPSDLEKQKRLYSVVSGKKISPQGRPSQIGFAPPPLFEHPDAKSGNLSMKELANLLNIDSELINAGSYVRRDETTVQGHSRVELAESHIRKAHICVRKAKQICKWLTSLHLQEGEINLQNYDKEFASGVYLAKLIRFLIPGSEFPQINERALSRGAALKNIELSLQIIWRSKSVNSSRIASSSEIFEGNKLKIMIMLQEIFDVYVRKPLFGQAVKMLKWFNQILKQYNRRLPIEVFTEADYSDVWKTFQSGTALFCLIYHLYGPNLIGEGHNIVRVDPMRVVNRPTNIIEFKSNVVYAFSLLKALKIEICWDPIDWITYPDVDFMMIQLQYIYEVIKGKHCVLPPAMGNVAGVASSVSGEPLVVGMIFSDTITVSIPTATAGKPIGETSKKRRAVGMIGSSEDNVTLLPIDSTGKSGRFALSMCPFGLLSGNMRVVEGPIAMKGARVVKKSNWNSASDNNPEQDRMLGSKHVEKLKFKNQVTTSKKSSKLLQNFSHHRVAGGIEDLSMERPTEVTVHEYTKDGYKNNTMKINPDGSIPTASLPSVSVEIVATAIEKLEKDMADAEADIELSENDLSSQYLELEANAHKMGAKDYEKQLLLLEKSRQSLEDERNNLHESFALRMESIKMQHAEAVARADAGEVKETPPSPSGRASGFKKKDAPLLAKVSSPSSTLKSPVSSPSKSPSKSSTKSASARGDNSSVGSAKIVQREWISASHSDKSHNVVLKKKAELAERSFHHQHLHPRAKARAEKLASDADVSRATSITTDRKKLSDVDIEHMSVDEAWESFLVDLNARTEVWGTEAAKVRKKPDIKSKDLGTSSVKTSQDAGPGTANVSGMLNAGVSIQAVAKGNLVATTVRNEELKAMLAEDKRRQTWMEQQALNDVQSSVERRLSMNELKASLNTGRKSNANLDTKMIEMMKANESKLFNKKDAENGADNAGSKDTINCDKPSVVVPRFDPRTFAPKDAESAFKWLQASRQFLLVDRISKTQYFFQLIKDGSSSKAGHNYIFTWKNLIHSQTFEGSISLKLCKDVSLSPKDPSMLVISIQKSPTALKQSGGRSSITIKCTSEIECGKYLASLNLLMKGDDENGNQNTNNSNNDIMKQGVSAKNNGDVAITSN